MTVGKIIDEKEQNDLKDLKQQIESLAMIIKGKGRGFLSKEEEILGTLLRKGCRDHLGKEKYLSDQGRNLSTVSGVMVGVMDGVIAQHWKT